MRKKTNNKKNLLGTFFRKYLDFMQHVKLSKRIFVTFLVSIITMAILFIFNTFTILEIRDSVHELNGAKQNQLILQYFSSTMNLTQVNAEYAKRLILGNVPLEPTEEDQLSVVLPSLIETSMPKVNAIIKKTAPLKLHFFNSYIGEVRKSIQRWSRDKSQKNLLQLSASINGAQMAISNIMVDLSSKAEADIAQIENRIGLTVIFSLIINIILIGMMIILILPLLSEIKKAFAPLKEASASSLQGAQESLNYATRITDSINQLQQVLHDMVLGITDVATGAQESSLQSSNIINSVKIASELVTDLAQKANQIHDNLNSYQNDLESKIQDIKQFSVEVNKALAVVQNNTDVAETLASKLTLLETNVKDISTILMSVSEITDQTNLLALNASIEAARAGQYGLGFDVVAQRIRDLSDQTKKLTSGIKKTVKGIEQVSLEVSDSLKNVITSVRNSAAEVSEVTSEFAQLEEVFHSLYNSNETIIDSATVQVESTNRIDLQTQEIMKTIKNISIQTESVSAAMQELSASSEEINAQIEVIGNMVNDTQNVIENQVKLVELAKATTEKI